MSTAPSTADRVPFYLLLGWFAATALWWFMALVDLPPDTPDWVVRARYVCFGTAENGLPDASGWLLLTASPLSFLAVLLAVWGRELARDLARRWRDPAPRALLCVLAALPLLGAAWAAGQVADGLARGQAWEGGTERGPFPEDYPRLNRPAPDFALVDQRGRPVTLADLRGEVVFLTFAFAHCNTICPVTVQNVLRGAGQVAEPHRVVVITLDPWRDTAGSLPAIAGRWGLQAEQGLVLSESVPTVNAVLDRYDVPRQRDLSTGEITHPPLVYVIDPQGRIAYALNRPSPQWVAAAGRRAYSEAPEARPAQGRM